MTERRLPILCLDFDGVLHSYTSGWQGADIVGDPPVPGAIEFLKAATGEFDVCIYSSRSHQTGGIAAMKRAIELWARAEYGMIPFWLDLITYPAVKPPAKVTLDDRALNFAGEWPAIGTLLEFEPWNKRS